MRRDIHICYLSSLALPLSLLLVSACISRSCSCLSRTFLRTDSGDSVLLQSTNVYLRGYRLLIRYIGSISVRVILVTIYFGLVCVEAFYCRSSWFPDFLFCLHTQNSYDGYLDYFLHRVHILRDRLYLSCPLAWRTYTRRGGGELAMCCCVTKLLESHILHYLLPQSRGFYINSCLQQVF